MPKAETREQAKARLKAELAKIEAAEKAEQGQREAILGRIVMKAMKADSDLDQKVRNLLESALTKKRDRALFGFEAKTAKMEQNGLSEDAPQSSTWQGRG